MSHWDLWTELSNTILAWATEINGKRHLSISICHAEQLAHGQGMQNRFFSLQTFRVSPCGQTGTGLLEVSQEIHLSSPQQYRSDQKSLAIPTHWMDLNKHRATAWPVPRDLHCHRSSHWCGSPRGKSSLGWETDGVAPNQQSVELVLPHFMPPPAWEETMKRQRSLTLQALCSSHLKSHIHIHSVLQPPSTWYYSLPLLQPGTWPAQISTKR